MANRWLIVVNNAIVFLNTFFIQYIAASVIVASIVVIMTLNK